jgi:hypothetical protein
VRDTHHKIHEPHARQNFIQEAERSCSWDGAVGWRQKVKIREPQKNKGDNHVHRFVQHVFGFSIALQAVYTPLVMVKPAVLLSQCDKVTPQSAVWLLATTRNSVIVLRYP